MVIDMLCHWRYVIDNLFGSVTAVSCRAATHVGERVDERGVRYACTADDSAYATFETDQGILVHLNSSWCYRVRRDDLLTLQVDGTKGSAVAGLRDCWTQRAETTPRPVWNPDLPDPLDYTAMWSDVPDNQIIGNGFKTQWELFLRAAARGEPFAWDLFAGARGVQFAELAVRSSDEGRRVEVPA